ncbi:hypothetical protein BJY52DRAFT_1215941 [Lactarius psammicola]|nr:hypothetical protein BJY52DRAFT_1215941 [Lactarius psammicola]
MVHIQQHIANPYVAGDNQQAVHWGGVPQAVGNLAVQGEMQDPHHIDALHYNAAYYHPPQPHYPEGPHARMQQDVGIAQGIPAQAHAFAPEDPVQENHHGLFGYNVQAPGADQAFPGFQPHPAPFFNVPPANGLRNLTGRYLNNPDTRINMVWIEPGLGGRFRVWIALELADIF